MRALVVGIDADQDFMKELFPSNFRKRSALRALVTNPGIQAALLMRVASGGGAMGLVARKKLLAAFACDVSAGSEIRGGIYLPHPVAIVIGARVVLHSNVALYQGVTLGANRSGGYPEIQTGSSLLPYSIIVGQVSVGPNAVVGAGVFCDKDVDAGVTLRHSTR